MVSTARRRSGTGRRSPTKAGRSPFKKKAMSRLAEEKSEASTNSAAANIKVAIRVRPENEQELAGNFKNVIKVVDDRMLVFDPDEDQDDFFFHGQKQGRRDLNKKAKRDQKFTFDAVFGPGSTNEDLFAGTTRELVDVVFDGYNCSVFVYGATGAGKTHTMLGSPGNPGIIFRTVFELYNQIEAVRDDVQCEVVVSYLEVYNEAVVDLMNPGTGATLQIREDGKTAVNIPGLSRHRPSGPDELLRLLQYGNGNRTQHPTDANKESSRSHAVFQVYLKQTSTKSGLSGDVKVAKLSMIDLAGSEKGSVTSSRSAARFREGANINKSLLALGNCINALAEGSKYIPYRNSKLTRLLKDSIGGNCRTVMISNITSSSMSYEDTFNTLGYAERAKRIKVKLTKNQHNVEFHVAQYAKIVENLKGEIKELRVKVACLEAENERLRTAGDEGRQAGEAPAADTSEVDALRAKLADYEARQCDYDELRKRMAAAEEAARQPPPAPPAAANDEEMLGFASESARLWADRSAHRLARVRRELLRRKLDRARIVDPDGDVSGSRIGRCVRELARKSGRLARKNAQLADRLAGREAELEARVALDDEFWSRVARKKSDAAARHATRLVEMMYHEENRTGAVLDEALRQLRACVDLLGTNPAVVQQFNSLVAQIRCTSIQFQDYSLVETNEDVVADRIGDFYGRIVDLDADSADDAGAAPANETVVADPAASSAAANDNAGDLILPLVVDKSSADEDPEAADDEYVSPVKWRPPTPIKGEKRHGTTPSPPDLVSVAKRIGGDEMDATFDVNGSAKVCDTTFQVEEADDPSPGEADNAHKDNAGMDATFDAPADRSGEAASPPTEAKRRRGRDEEPSPSTLNLLRSTLAKFSAAKASDDAGEDDGVRIAAALKAPADDSCRRGTFTISAPNVAVVSPTITASIDDEAKTRGRPVAAAHPVVSSAFSVPTADRRVDHVMRKAPPSRRLQTSQSTSVLRPPGGPANSSAKKKAAGPARPLSGSSENLSSGEPAHSGPSYMQATTASSRKFRAAATLSESGHNNNNHNNTNNNHNNHNNNHHQQLPSVSENQMPPALEAASNRSGAKPGTGGNSRMRRIQSAMTLKQINK